MAIAPVYAKGGLHVKSGIFIFCVSPYGIFIGSHWNCGHIDGSGAYVALGFHNFVCSECDREFVFWTTYKPSAIGSFIMNKVLRMIKSEVPVEMDGRSLIPVKHLFSPWKLVETQAGRVGYLIVWLFGVPASVLFLIFLIRGH
jgi:hypothetical protein